MAKLIHSPIRDRTAGSSNRSSMLGGGTLSSSSISLRRSFLARSPSVLVSLSCATWGLPFRSPSPSSQAAIVKGRARSGQTYCPLSLWALNCPQAAPTLVLDTSARLDLRGSFLLLISVIHTQEFRAERRCVRSLTMQEPSCRPRLPTRWSARMFVGQFYGSSSAGFRLEGSLSNPPSGRNAIPQTRGPSDCSQPHSVGRCDSVLRRTDCQGAEKPAARKVNKSCWREANPKLPRCTVGAVATQHGSQNLQDRGNGSQSGSLGPDINAGSHKSPFSALGALRQSWSKWLASTELQESDGEHS